MLIGSAFGLLAVLRRR
ncbi:MAG: hypothetical protein FJW36_25680 [Acidobacteria bacterium]|nr:hypothetical protein [Acidobacteriota bacterium]